MLSRRLYTIGERAYPVSLFLSRLNGLSKYDKMHEHFPNFVFRH